jgi:hypothetical protein
LLLFFLIACICSLYPVRNALPVCPMYLSDNKEKVTREYLTDVAHRRQKSGAQGQIRCFRFIFGSYAVSVPINFPNMQRHFL